jgi:hypothetical protein
MAMSIDISDDRQLWQHDQPKAEGFNWSKNSTLTYNKAFGVDDKADFYDKYVIKKVWPETFAKAYNKEIDMQETSFQQLTKAPKDHINPDHYQGIVANYQYIECMEFILGKEGLKSHLLGQIYKYLMRMGKKDSELQEVRKVVWYSRCLEILERDSTIIGKLGELK